MRIAKHAVCAVAGLLASLTAIMPAAAEECTLKQFAWLDMQDDQFGSVVVPITIAEKVTPMTIDTGASHSWVTEEFADSIPGTRLHTTLSHGLYFKDAAGETLTQAIHVKSLQIGALKIDKRAHFMIAPAGSSGRLDTGLLGINILKNFDLELDMAAKKVGFYVSHDCPGKSPVHWAAQWGEVPMRVDNHVIIDVTLDGKRVSAYLDTGATKSVIDTELAKDFGSDPGASNAADDEFLAISGESVKAHRAGFKTLSVSDIGVHNPEFFVTKVYSPSVKMILGMDKLRSLHLYFAFKQKKIYVTAAKP
jgi:predicted aspartyl protease